MKKKPIVLGLLAAGLAITFAVQEFSAQDGAESLPLAASPEPAPTPSSPPLSLISSAWASQPVDVVSDRVILKFDAPLQSGPGGEYLIPKAVSSAFTKHGVSIQQVVPLADFGEGIYRIKLMAPPGSRAQMNDLLASVALLPHVAAIEEDVVVQPLTLPNDTLLAQQWALASRTPESAAISAVDAWPKLTGEAPVIAIIDSGITPHSDLAAQVLPGYNFISDPLIAGNATGRSNDASDLGDWIDETDRQNPRFEQCQIKTSSWHGTHVAGIAAATANNNQGIAGVSPNSKILPVRVLGKCGGYLSDVATGVLWAAGISVIDTPDNPNPAKVINMSLGGQSSCGILMGSAILRATARGSLVIAAGGNSNQSVKTTAPANCPGVVSVGATTRTGERAGYSNFGPLTVAAPGGYGQQNDSSNLILSTFNAGLTTPAAEAYAYQQGTSMAAPHVAGVAALIAQANSALSPSEIRSILIRTATPFAEGSTCATEKNCGPGIINAPAAVDEATTFKPNLFAEKIRGNEYWVPLIPADLTLTVGNSGNMGYKGPLSIKVYLSTSFVYSASENPVLVGEVNTETNLSAVKGRTNVRIPVAIPDSVADGTYYLVTRINGESDGALEQSVQDNEIDHGPVSVVRPQFTATVKQTTDQVPALTRIVVEPTDRKLLSLTKSWSYNWTIPTGIDVKQGKGRDIRLLMNTPSEQTVSLMVASPGGEYSQQIQVPITARDADPFMLGLTIRPSNQFRRAPLSLIVVPQISGGHPEDRLISNTLTVGEGDTIQETNRSRAIFADLPAGEHTVRFAGETRHGKRLEFLETITVVPNIPPVCGLLAKKGRESYSFFAQCTDEDGRIKRYEWEVNGESRRATSSRLIVPLDLAIEGKITVKMTGYDDSGDGHAVTEIVDVH